MAEASQSRKHRGYATERLVARYWQESGFPYAEVVRGQGSDLTGTGPVRCEIKARRGFNPLEWLRQASGNARHNDVPCVVVRSNGQGPKDIDNWLVMCSHETWLRLLNEAGYGAGAE